MGNELNELECGLKELRDDPVKFVERLLAESNLEMSSYQVYIFGEWKASPLP